MIEIEKFILLRNLNLNQNQCLSSLMLWVRISIRARCTTLCDKVCQWLATGQWCSAVPPPRYIYEILLKVAFNTMKPTNQSRV